MKKRDFYLYIINEIKNGLSLREIAANLNISKQGLSYHIRRLKQLSILEKKGYGVWQINEKKSKNALVVGSQNTKSSDKIRGHGFQFVLKIPSLPRWDKRREYLIKKDIDFKDILINSQSIIVKGFKVWLSPKSIVVYFPSYKSYFTNTSLESRNYAVYDFLQVIRSLEHLLNISLSYGRNYMFRISRNHYSLIKNELAKQYDREGNKLEVRDQGGLWLLIDNSFNLHELEAVHPRTAIVDANIVQNYFNDMKTRPSYLPSEAKMLLDGFVTNIKEYNKNIELHLETLRDIKKTMRAIRHDLKKRG